MSTFPNYPEKKKPAAPLRRSRNDKISTGNRSQHSTITQNFTHACTHTWQSMLLLCYS